MPDLKTQAEELGIKIDGRWSDERIQQEIDAKKSETAFGGKGDHDGDGKPGGTAKTTTVRLLRNYRPVGEFEIVGHEQPAQFKKNAAGEDVQVKAAVFIEGEQPPPAQPGTGFETKIWAGTVIRLPVEEAKNIKRLGIAEYELVD